MCFIYEFLCYNKYVNINDMRGKFVSLFFRRKEIKTKKINYISKQNKFNKEDNKMAKLFALKKKILVL